VCALVALLLEVQVVGQSVLARLAGANGCEDNLHIELAPTLLVDPEGRAAELLAHALWAERLVEDVSRLFIAGSGELVAVGANEEDLDIPAAHGNALDLHGVIAGKVLVLCVRGRGGCWQWHT
jgi:hypothetical protein